jgi:hypothetical protein
MKKENKSWAVLIQKIRAMASLFRTCLLAHFMRLELAIFVGTGFL